MEKFLKPFLEKGGVYSLGKVPVLTNGVVECNIKLLQKVIFKHDVLVEFKEVLNSTCSSEPFTVKNDIIKKTIQRLCEFMLSDDNVADKIDVFCCVLQTFAAGCKDDSLPLVQFFVVLSHILGIHALPNVSVKDTDDSGDLINVKNFQEAFNVNLPSVSSDSLQIFKELLQLLTKSSVNLNLTEVQSYYKWLQQLLKNLAHSQPFQSIILEIFITSANLELKLLEGNLDYIFNNILSQRLPFDENFCDSYETFLNKSINICSKFQRTVKFITKFLSSLKTTTTELEKEFILPKNFTNEFAKTISTTSNQQCLSLLEILVQNVDECFNNISQNSEYNSPLLGIASELLVSFLKEVKLFAPSIASSTLQKFIDKLTIFKESLQNFGNFLFSKKNFMSKNEEVVRVFIELCFYCGEIQMLINFYKDSVLQPNDTIVSSADFDWQCCISLDQWDKLVNYILKSKLKSCGSVCLQLALQKLRHCKLENVSSAIDDSTVKIIMYQLTSSFNEFNILQWVSPEDFVLLMEFLTVKQTKSVTRNLLKQMLENENRTELIAWLSNFTLQENSVFIVSLFSELLKETGSLVTDVLGEKSQSRFSWLLDEYFNDENSIRVENIERLPEIINQLLKNTKKIRKSLNKNSNQNVSLVRIVEIFKLLPLPQLKNDIRRLGLSFAVGIGTFLTNDESSIRLLFESICNFLVSDMDASTSFDIGLCIKWLSDLSYENETDDFKVKVIESLIRNSPNMKFGLNQVGEMIDSSDNTKHANPLKTLETRVVLYNELGKCWQRAKKRKSDNDLIGSFRIKLAKMISEESKELEEDNINPLNSKILLKILAIEINKAIKANEEEELENLMKKKFPSHFEFAVKNLKNGFDEPSASFLTVTLQAMPQLKKYLPEGAFLKIWKSFRVYEKMNWRLFCNHSNDEEFSEVLTDLLKMSKKILTSESIKHSSNCFEIWVSFFEFCEASKRNSCQLRLQELFNYIHECHLLLKDLPIKKKIFLIKFFVFCLNKKEVVITSHLLDAIILVILECPDDSPSVQDFHDLFTVEAEAASAILLRQFAWSKSKVHLTFVIFKRLLNSLISKCNTGQEINKEDVIMLSTCAFSLEKWSNVIIKREKDFARISGYFLTALISSIASVTIVPAVKFHLNNCINHFLSISDSHTVAYLMRILKPGYQQVFNTAYDQFKKYHKYSGKI